MQLVDLGDHSLSAAGSSDTVNSVWNSTRLENVQHTLAVSVALGEPYAIVDSLMSAFFHKLFLSLPLTLGAGTRIRR